MENSLGCLGCKAPDMIYMEKLRIMMGLNSYLGEYKTMSLYFSKIPCESSAQMMWKLIEKVTPNPSISEKTRLSHNFREQGNYLFTDSAENIIAATQLYTKAIFSAPIGSEALALAHANRAVALQKFGYFQQAYDDCECALEQNYPENRKHKIIARQAKCAEKLGNVTLLEKHLNKLKEIPLKGSFKDLMEELQESLKSLQLKENVAEGYEQSFKQYRGPVKIVENALKGGRRLLAEKPIKKGQLIFTDRVSSFIPATHTHVCQQCAATHFIPFPCYRCDARVLYCSRKCRVEHETVHAHECLAYQRGIFITEPDSHLALRMILDGVPKIIPFLCQKNTSTEIWNELAYEDSPLMKSDIEYVQSLRLPTHLAKNSTINILGLANDSYIISWYLRNQTEFFKIFEKTKASPTDWQKVLATLLLRHLGQIRVNGTVIISELIIKNSDSTLLYNELWHSPCHVRRGFLHKFSTSAPVIIGNLPYLSYCKNKLVTSITTKRNGRSVRAFAAENIETNEEILYADIIHDPRFKQMNYQPPLHLEFYDFGCMCERCAKENSKKESNKFCCYKCENPMCRDIFSSNFSILQIVNSAKETTFQCPMCQTVQYQFINKVRDLDRMLNVEYHVPLDVPLITASIKRLNALDKWLLDPHFIKFEFSIKLVEKFFPLFFDCSTQICDHLHNQFVKILKYHLHCNFEKSIDYIGPMTFLWDLIALDKYKCYIGEMNEMLQAIEVLPDDTKEVFINYYNDYMKSKII